MIIELKQCKIHTCARYYEPQYYSTQIAPVMWYSRLDKAHIVPVFAEFCDIIYIMYPASISEKI